MFPDTQLSPPLKLPQPGGAVGMTSGGIKVGRMAGGWLAVTGPVPAGAVVVDVVEVVIVVVVVGFELVLEVTTVLEELEEIVELGSW